MKKLIATATLISLVALAAPVFAADVDVNVGASSDFLVRGQSVTGDKPAVFGSLKFNDVLVKNAFVSVDGIVLNPSPVSKTKTLRSEFGVGYEFAFSKVSGYAGLYRVFNPVLYSADYNEARVQVEYSPTDTISLYGKAAQIVSSSTDKDSYVALGAKYNGLMHDKLSLSVQFSGLRDGRTNDFAYNNTELTAEYKISKGLYAFGTYSIGGDTASKVFRSTTTNVPSQGLVGVRYQF